jgi:ubiquinone/menaquinone biosynthesis C-methylase UbiE
MKVPELERKRQEVQHGRHIAGQAERVWRRDTLAGKKRMQRRFEDLREYLQPAPDARMLELGCGTGTWSEFLVQLPIHLTSVDISPDLLAVARQKITAPHAEFVEGDVEKLPFAAHSFDAICGLSVLHHLDLPKVLGELHRVAKPGARLWFSEPNMLNPQILVQKNVPLIKRWLGDTPNETAFFRWPLARALKRAGFEEISVRPFDFLHPQIPDALTSTIERLGVVLERIPAIREIGGSLLIHARR